MVRAAFPNLNVRSATPPLSSTSQLSTNSSITIVQPGSTSSVTDVPYDIDVDEQFVEDPFGAVDPHWAKNHNEIPSTANTQSIHFRYPKA